MSAERRRGIKTSLYRERGIIPEVSKQDSKLLDARGLQPIFSPLVGRPSPLRDLEDWRQDEAASVGNALETSTAASQRDWEDQLASLSRPFVDLGKAEATRRWSSSGQSGEVASSHPWSDLRRAAYYGSEFDSVESSRGDESAYSSVAFPPSLEGLRTHGSGDIDALLLRLANSDGGAPGDSDQVDDVLVDQLLDMYLSPPPKEPKGITRAAANVASDEFQYFSTRSASVIGTAPRPPAFLTSSRTGLETSSKIAASTSVRASEQFEDKQVGSVADELSSVDAAERSLVSTSMPPIESNGPLSERSGFISHVIDGAGFGVTFRWTDRAYPSPSASSTLAHQSWHKRGGRRPLALVESVLREAPAHGQIFPGDVVVSIDNQEVVDMHETDFRRFVTGRAGTVIIFELLRQTGVGKQFISVCLTCEDAGGYRSSGDARLGFLFQPMLKAAPEDQLVQPSSAQVHRFPSDGSNNDVARPPLSYESLTHFTSRSTPPSVMPRRPHPDQPEPQTGLAELTPATPTEYLLTCERQMLLACEHPSKALAPAVDSAAEGKAGGDETVLSSAHILARLRVLSEVASVLGSDALTTATTLPSSPSSPQRPRYPAEPADVLDTGAGPLPTHPLEPRSGSGQHQSGDLAGYTFARHVNYEADGMLMDVPRQPREPAERHHERPTRSDADHDRSGSFKDYADARAQLQSQGRNMAASVSEVGGAPRSQWAFGLAEISSEELPLLPPPVRPPLPPPVRPPLPPPVRPPLPPPTKQGVGDSRMGQARMGEVGGVRVSLPETSTGERAALAARGNAAGLFQAAEADAAVVAEGVDVAKRTDSQGLERAGVPAREVGLDGSNVVAQNPALEERIQHLDSTINNLLSSLKPAVEPTLAPPAPLSPALREGRPETPPVTLVRPLPEPVSLANHGAQRGSVVEAEVSVALAWEAQAQAQAQAQAASQAQAAQEAAQAQAAQAQAAQAQAAQEAAQAQAAQEAAQEAAQAQAAQEAAQAQNAQEAAQAQAAHAQAAQEAAQAQAAQEAAQAQAAQEAAQAQAAQEAAQAQAVQKAAQAQAAQEAAQAQVAHAQAAQALAQAAAHSEVQLDGAGNMAAQVLLQAQMATHLAAGHVAEKEPPRTSAAEVHSWRIQQVLKKVTPSASVSARAPTAVDAQIDTAPPPALTLPPALLPLPPAVLPLPPAQLQPLQSPHMSHTALLPSMPPTIDKGSPAPTPSSNPATAAIDGGGGKGPAQFLWNSDGPLGDQIRDQLNPRLKR